MLSPEIVGNIPEVLTTIGTLGFLMAFSKKSRTEIGGRANWHSEVSGVGGGKFEASHLDHTRNETYDNPERGILMTILEHLIYHRVHRGRANDIGLSESENESAIGLLIGRAKNE